MLGHHRQARDTPFLWRADDGPLFVLFGSSLLSSTKKNQSWTLSGKTFWTRAWLEPTFLYTNAVLFICHTKHTYIYGDIAVVPNVPWQLNRSTAQITFWCWERKRAQAVICAIMFLWLLDLWQCVLEHPKAQPETTSDLTYIYIFKVGL